MAWSYYNSGFRNIRVKVAGNEMPMPEVVYFPEMLADGINKLLNYGWNGTTYSKSVYNTVDPTEYANIVGLNMGSLDIYSWCENMSTGQTIEIYNAELGDRVAYVLEFRGNYTFWVHIRLGAIYTGGLVAFSLPYGMTYKVPPWAGLGFIFDFDRGYALPFWAIRFSELRSETTFEASYRTASGAVYTDTNKSYFSVAALAIFRDRYVPPEPSDNPYSDGSFSEPSGDPTGDYDDTSDVISVPSVPSFNLGITSLINVWVPSTTDINNLASYLWSNFDLTDPTKTLSKMFTDPLSYILSLHMLPFTVDSSTAITVTLAGLATTVSMPPATVQFKDIDCGSVTINEYWGNYLDYTYTKIVLCLPFCGQVDLDPDEVMGKTIKVKYRVDIITGAFVCFVYIDGDKVLGQYAGNCAAQIPISAADFSRLNAAVLGVAGAAASAFGSAALGGHGGMLNGASGGLISSIAANSQNAKVRAQHSGGLTGAPGFMGIQKPYLIIHRPRQSVPEDYEQFKGYPSNVTMQLSSCTGFTSVREIKLNGLPFTDGELSELKSILEGGVIL